MERKLKSDKTKITSSGLEKIAPGFQNRKVFFRPDSGTTYIVGDTHVCVGKIVTKPQKVSLRSQRLG